MYDTFMLDNRNDTFNNEKRINNFFKFMLIFITIYENEIEEKWQQNMYTNKKNQLIPYPVLKN